MTEILSCPNCLDEKLIKVANGLGALVCPGCDYIKRPTPVKLEDDPERFKGDL